MKTLEQLIGAPPQSTIELPDAYFTRFGMSKNPFPTGRTIIPQVIYNQDRAMGVFANRVKDVLSSTPQKRALVVLGGTGAGKTHFLRACQYQFEEYTRSLEMPFIVVEFPAGTSSVASLLREVLRRGDEIAKQKGDYDLLSALMDQIKEPDDLAPVKQTDLLKVLTLLVRSRRADFLPPDRDGIMGYDALRELTKRWLSGATLTQTERKHLGVFSRLATPSMMIRVLSEYFSLARARKIVAGIVVCLDEVEALFTGQSSTGKIQGFLQDLRYFFDESIRGETGYALLIVSASTQTGATSLRDFNYPLYQRLGFEGDTGVELDPIQGMAEVREFAATYVNFERDKTKDLQSRNVDTKFPDLLSPDELETSFKIATAATRNAAMRSKGSVSQGQLLDALHNVVEGRRH